MRASQHPQLGRVVAEIIKTANDLENDPMNDYAGFTPDATWALDAIIKREGFANGFHFIAVVQRRTSDRWVHFNLPYSATPRPG